MSDLRKALKSEKIQTLKLRPPLALARTSALKDVFARMKEQKLGYAVLIDGKKVVGIFTERDAMTRVVAQNLDPATPVEKVMTANPMVLKETDSIADAIRLMSQGSYRHIPLVDDNGDIAGLLGVRDVVQYLAEHYPWEVYNLPPDPHQVMGTPEGA